MAAMRRGHRPGTEGHAEAPPAAAVRSAPDPEETDVWLSPAAPAGWTGHAPPSSARPVPISHSGPEFLAFVGAQTVSCFGATALQLENTLQMLKEKQLSMERAGSLPYHFFAQRRPQARDHIAYMRWEGASSCRGPPPPARCLLGVALLGTRRRFGSTKGREHPGRVRAVPGDAAGAGAAVGGGARLSRRAARSPRLSRSRHVGHAAMVYGVAWAAAEEPPGLECRLLGLGPAALTGDALLPQQRA